MLLRLSEKLGCVRPWGFFSLLAPLCVNFAVLVENISCVKVVACKCFVPICLVIIHLVQ